MNEVKTFYKNLGETPLEALDRFREEFPEYNIDKTLNPPGRVKLSYAGRLDPMAEGVVLIMIGEANKEREKYLGLDKEYEFEVLFGVETDTYDILGLIQNKHPQCCREKIYTMYCMCLDKNRAMLRSIKDEEMQEMISQFVGEIELEYPPYSSKTVDGKPLFQWAREGRLDEIKIPKREVEIYSLELNEAGPCSGGEILDEVLSRIDLVKGDFRQEPIKESWQRWMEGKEEEEFKMAKFSIRCSSGTYVRTIAHEFGKRLGTGAIAFSIKRTKVRNHS